MPDLLHYIALIIAFFIFARKNKQYNTVGKLSAAPGIFNINEPLLFGLPIVLNPVLFVPFILTPMINVTIAFFATKWGWVPAATVAPPWTTPPIINGFLATQSWRGAVLSMALIVIAVCIYLPFISMVNRNWLFKRTLLFGSITFRYGIFRSGRSIDVT